MYDALNRGFSRGTGDIFAYLNCDEQYLPGALQQVSTYFAAHPEIDMVFGDVIIVNGNGDYLRHRKMLAPRLYHTWTAHLSTLSCGMFFRRKLIATYGELFNAGLRDVGDGEWMLRLLKRGVTMDALGTFTSVFTETGVNMSAGE